MEPQSIGVNAIHPTDVNTHMLQNPCMYKTFRPDSPIPYVEPSDISHAVAHLASDESRYVTGQQLFVDAGASLQLGL